MMILWYMIASIFGYLFGSINSSIILSLVIFKKDIRTFGSGNAGLTNTLRSFGKLAALIVLLGDILKGVLAVYLGMKFASYNGMLLGGLFCILGHNWPVYFKFKGGKGFLTSASVIMAIDWKIGLMIGLIAISIMAITRFVSLGSLVWAAILPLFVLYFGSYRGIDNNLFLIFSIVIAVLAIVRHKDNIIRLLKGTERKLGQKVKVN